MYEDIMLVSFSLYILYILSYINITNAGYLIYNLAKRNH